MVYLFILIAIILFVISPTVRNYSKFKNGYELEKNLGGYIVEKFFKKKWGRFHQIFLAFVLSNDYLSMFIIIDKIKKINKIFEVTYEKN